LRFPRRQPTVVRRVARFLALGALLALGWALAPPLSAERHAPGARDFEQRLFSVHRVAHAERSTTEDAHHHDHGPVTHRTAVIAAPARFDAVGLARELRPLELRARDAGGEWSEWAEIANGDPAWFGGADELQLRARGYRPRGSLHYVDVPEAATAARAAPAKPGIVSRREWGAERNSGGCEPRRKPDYGRVKAAVVHHTVGSNNYTRAEAPGVVLAICRYHRNALNWDDIGYQALVDRFGNIYEGRDGGLGRPVVGAQAQGVNAQTTGVALMGTHTNKGITASALRGVSKWLTWKLAQHGVSAQGRARLESAGGATSRYDKGDKFRVKTIIGHRKTNLTACPGNGLNAQLAKIRRRVQNLTDESGGGGIG
jgi:N-acetylmuramoyl-L-alanine amidase